MGYLSRLARMAGAERPPSAPGTAEPGAASAEPGAAELTAESGAAETLAVTEDRIVVDGSGSVEGRLPAPGSEASSPRRSRRTPPDGPVAPDPRADSPLDGPPGDAARDISSSEEGTTPRVRVPGPSEASPVEVADPGRPSVEATTAAESSHVGKRPDGGAPASSDAEAPPTAPETRVALPAIEDSSSSEPTPAAGSIATGLVGELGTETLTRPGELEPGAVRDLEGFEAALRRVRRWMGDSDRVELPDSAEASRPAIPAPEPVGPEAATTAGAALTPAAQAATPATPPVEERLEISVGAVHITVEEPVGRPRSSDPPRSPSTTPATPPPTRFPGRPLARHHQREW